MEEWMALCAFWWVQRVVEGIDGYGISPPVATFIRTLTLARATSGADGIHRNGTIDYLVDMKQAKKYSS